MGFKGKKCMSCGCEEEIKATCSFVGETYPELGIYKGDTVEDSVYKIFGKVQRVTGVKDGVFPTSLNVDSDNLLTFELTDGVVIEAGVINIIE